MGKKAAEKPAWKISEETTNLITAFYIRDDIFRLMKGKNYNVSQKLCRLIKIRCRKRILVHTLKEAYVLFCKDNPDFSFLRKAL